MNYVIDEDASDDFLDLPDLTYETGDYESAMRAAGLDPDATPEERLAASAARRRAAGEPPPPRLPAPVTK